MEFGKKQIKALAAAIKKLKGGNPKQCHLSIEDFQTLFGLDEKGAALVHKVFDLDGNGTIEFNELISGFTLLSNESDEKKAHFLFQIWDADGNGVLDREEIYQMVYSTVSISAALIASELAEELGKLIGMKVDTESSEFKTKTQMEISQKIDPQDVQNAVNDLFEQIDENGDGEISLEEFTNHCKSNENSLAPFVEAIQKVLKPQKGSCRIF
ncbi:calcium binding protein [Anaeramoeba ignava]|uniref:Calcium binding protein n=1 Tax=Anaeramoeba ignava TaxID=1746090 RepID=A0A9Q0LPX3_ANAIG|nr:calcium binding protein [Anaeramoeba ignava]|eukprot:Anaeramoba_ignava/a355455_38.p1 GENE.a355455_38~~a355455_38.p1  ORF type:complete len:212 (-),score=86.18 a355455_38:137-772(-)